MTCMLLISHEQVQCIHRISDHLALCKDTKANTSSVVSRLTATSSKVTPVSGTSENLDLDLPNSMGPPMPPKPPPPGMPPPPCCTIQSAQCNKLQQLHCGNPLQSQREYRRAVAADVAGVIIVSVVRCPDIAHKLSKPRHACSKPRLLERNPRVAPGRLHRGTGRKARRRR